MIGEYAGQEPSGVCYIAAARCDDCPIAKWNFDESTTVDCWKSVEEMEALASADNDIQIKEKSRAVKKIRERVGDTAATVAVLEALDHRQSGNC